MVVCMMVIGYITKWKDMVNYIINQVKLHIKEIGKMINFKDMENYITNYLINYNNSLIIKISI